MRRRVRRQKEAIEYLLKESTKLEEVERETILGLEDIFRELECGKKEALEALDAQKVKNEEMQLRIMQTLEEITLMTAVCNEEDERDRERKKGAKVGVKRSSKHEGDVEETIGIMNTKRKQSHGKGNSSDGISMYNESLL